MTHFRLRSGALVLGAFLAFAQIPSASAMNPNSSAGESILLDLFMAELTLWRTTRLAFTPFPAGSTLPETWFRAIDASCSAGMESCEANVMATLDGATGTLSYTVVMVPSSIPDTFNIETVVECEDANPSTNSICNNPTSTETKCRELMYAANSVSSSEIFGDTILFDATKHVATTAEGELGPADDQTGCDPAYLELFSETDYFSRQTKVKGSKVTISEGHGVSATDMPRLLISKTIDRFQQVIKGDNGDIEGTSIECATDDLRICFRQTECGGGIFLDEETGLRIVAWTCEDRDCPECGGF